ncbi:MULTISPECIES: trypsin-like peptidase domain-containing protein [Streptomyces]|uniref:Trypsin-like peptidase domain-containing protein n=1 Tax=Streptomyces koelreuteriae TaxID=2838015 RepID=A0ABX8FTM3_9ACTN|nr:MULTISPECIES: trypsin-like peptidase domain-containing protein [Streptomyces]QWB24347.1 trypsin-like peptidase domain-containing protein [Streptomyces koelreuteriae]UUA07349.1 serine protease [Streptomyces koelreuteriae]UUA14978.1 serine protease [Streptomyces sp. CRCS-T-1]
MPWFSPPGPSRPATVSVFPPSGGRKCVGAGVLLPGSRVLTAAHVVNLALGRENEYDAAHPGKETVLRVRVGGHWQNARVKVWIPVRERTELRWKGDLAVLELPDGVPPNLVPPPWRPVSEGLPVCAWHPAGPAEFSLARCKVVAVEAEFTYAVVDGGDTGATIQHGYSGGPVWCDEDRAVVGMVVGKVKGDEARAHHPDQVRRRSWFLPTQRVREELASAGAAHLLDTPHDTDEPDTSSEAFDLADILNRKVDSAKELARSGRVVAKKCGLGHPRDRSAPSVEEFARVLLTHPRALAELTQVLSAKPGAVAELLEVGARIPQCALLTHAERGRLDALLASLPHHIVATVPALVLDALPDIDLPDPLQTDADWLDADTVEAPLAALLDQLERNRRAPATERSHSPLLPALVCLVLHVAAVAPAPHADALVGWSTKVVRRTQGHQAALDERLAHARELTRRLRARQQNAPRLLVRVRRVDGEGDNCRFTLRMWRRETTTWQRVRIDERQARDTAETAGKIFTAASVLWRTGSLPIVELLLDRADLDLNPHWWKAPGPLNTHRALGVEFPVVFTCPELVEQGSDAEFLRERKKRLHRGVLVRIDASVTSLDEVYGRLAGEMNAVGAVIGEVEPAFRELVVQYCLAAGMPVVLFGRGEKGWSQAVSRLARVAPAALPNVVREYRRDAFNEPAVHLGRPVLAWCDDIGPPPEDLYLDDPSEELA